MRNILFICLAVLASIAPAGADDLPQSGAGKTAIGAYLEFSYMDDRGIGWSGSETTFAARAKLNIAHRVYDDILIRFNGEWKPTVNGYSRAYGQMKEREANPQDTYFQFDHPGEYPLTLRMGVVKVPFGHFDTLALSPRNRPAGMTRTREWDYGIRADGSAWLVDWSLAIVNGEGTEGTDSNSAKSVAARIVFPAAGAGDMYPETLEITGYPNPRAANPAGEFRWQFGASAYNGQKYSTPIKQKNSHYGADVKLDYSIFSLKAQYTFLEGGFTDPSVVSEPASTFTELQYSSAVSTSIDTYPRGYAAFAELAAGISEKTLLTLMGEMYDPDSESSATAKQRTKQRLVIGLKHDFRPRVSAALFYTLNDNPAFGVSGNILETDHWKGDEILMAAMAVQF
ncbi:MAG: hypothetical protein HZA04_05725 [Nitrospinae bacterium]|nr:hypothetical protein [Nitrospinota bacterium]